MLADRQQLHELRKQAPDEVRLAQWLEKSQASAAKYKFTGFIGLNTLFVALCNNEEFRALDFSALKLTASGGIPRYGVAVGDS